MAQIDIKQVRGGSQGSVLFLGTNSIVSEDFNSLNWDQSNNIFSINGNVKIVDGSQSSGYILTSDSNGVASWQAPDVLNATGSTNLGTYWTSNDELGFMNIGVSQSTGDIRYVDFDTTIENDVSTGRLSWNSNDGTLDLGLENDVILQIGQESHFRVKNQTGATISNGRLVSAVGTLGSSGRILASYSVADGSVPARFVMGIATSDIIDGADGYVTHFGLVRGIDATGTPYGETWNNGDVLWANPNVVGGLTNQEPEPGGNTGIKVEVALVIDNDTNGSIFVRVDNGKKLHELHDVEYDSTQLTDDSILKWNTSGQYWTQSINSFDNLSDTNIISATTNDTLRFDGTDWVNNSFVTSDESGTFSVNGTFVYIDGNQQSGYVLSTDGTGLAFWTQSQGSTSSVSEITISGTQNGTNRDFIMSESLSSSQNMFFINGQLVNSPDDYIISGTALTIDSSYPAPIESDSLRLFGTIDGIVGVGGISTLNGLSTDVQSFTSSSPDGNIEFNISSDTSTHTFTSNVLFNDTGTSSTDVWSADKIINYVSTTSPGVSSSISYGHFYVTNNTLSTSIGTADTYQLVTAVPTLDIETKDFILNNPAGGTGSPLIDPDGDGGFENGSTFADNGWTVVNGGETNQWFVGSTGSATGSNGAYISNDGGVTNAYSVSSTSISHFYRDITVPAATAILELTFDVRVQGEGTSTLYDYLRVNIADTSQTPVAGTLPPGTILQNINLEGANFVTVTINITQASILTSSDIRLIFSWVNDSSVGTQPPASIDNIELRAFGGACCFKYIGTETKVFHASTHLSVRSSSAAQIANIAIIKNGTASSVKSAMPINLTTANTRYMMSTQDTFELSTNDTITPVIKNESGTNALIVQAINFVVKETGL